MDYSAALKELNTIQLRLEAGGSDLDQLIADVKRADFLLNWCHEKLSEAELIVRDVFEETRDDQEE